MKNLTCFTYITRVILPGGHVKLNHSGYTQVGKKILQLAIKVCFFFVKGNIRNEKTMRNAALRLHCPFSLWLTASF